ALTTMWSCTRRSDMRRVRWIRPALLAAYEYVSSGLTAMPSMDAMWITLAGRAGDAAAFSGSCSARVRKNGDFRFKSTTLSQPCSGKSSNGAPHAAPALLTRMSSWGSRALSAAARPSAPATLETSAGSEVHDPSADSSAAAWSHASALRDEM